MIFVQNKQTATKRIYRYVAKQFVIYGQKWRAWNPAIMGGIA